MTLIWIQSTRMHPDSWCAGRVWTGSLRFWYRYRYGPGSSALNITRNWPDTRVARVSTTHYAGNNTGPPWPWTDTRPCECVRGVQGTGAKTRPTRTS